MVTTIKVGTKRLQAMEWDTEDEINAADVIGNALDHVEDFMRRMQELFDSTGSKQVEDIAWALKKEAAKLRQLATRCCGEPMSLQEAMRVEDLS